MIRPFVRRVAHKSFFDIILAAAKDSSNSAMSAGRMRVITAVSWEPLARGYGLFCTEPGIRLLRALRIRPRAPIALSMSTFFWFSKASQVAVAAKTTSALVRSLISHPSLNARRVTCAKVRLETRIDQRR